MKKNDYVLIASAIRETSKSENADKDTLLMLINRLHTKFQQDNPRYRGRTFEIACGISTEI